MENLKLIIGIAFFFVIILSIISFLKESPIVKIGFGIGFLILGLSLSYITSNYFADVIFIFGFLSLLSGIIEIFTGKDSDFL